jgi:transcriptional regulator with XRE-family HTH domain
MSKERKGTLDALLRDRGLTIYALCKKSGIARQTVTKLCNGAGNVHMGTVRKVAEALGMEPSELVAILQGDGIVVGSPA